VELGAGCELVGAGEGIEDPGGGRQRRRVFPNGIWRERTLGTGYGSGSGGKGDWVEPSSFFGPLFDDDDDDGGGGGWRAEWLGGAGGCVLPAATDALCDFC
jgi:hypothetical protein